MCCGFGCIISTETCFKLPQSFYYTYTVTFEYNKPCEDLEVQVQIFTISGKLVKTISKKIITPGTRIDDLTWDGRDDFGDRIGRGVYIYRVKLNTADESASETQKLVILK
ncbi:MAG TPA: FlgD immunoglobulin-like domain containing protein [Bacteroidia bacterium]|nr:FlgD immunoglobulin-like domain containing protein [Bacteroidia bacterium]